MLDRPADLLTQRVGRKIRLAQADWPFLTCVKARRNASSVAPGTATCSTHLVIVLEIEDRIEVRADLLDIAGVPGRKHNDRVGKSSQDCATPPKVISVPGPGCIAKTPMRSPE